MKSDYNKPAKSGWSRKYEEGYKKIKGNKCPDCDGSGVIKDEIGEGLYWCSVCEKCKGNGRIET